jgi:hypothetical protein
MRLACSGRSIAFRCWDRRSPAHVSLCRRYVALHLIPGLVATAAIMGFIVIAEEVVAGRTIAAFDVAFADALRANTSPRWQ